MMTPLREKVAEVLRSHAPPGAPDVFRSIVAAELTIDRDGANAIAAELVMFDGLPGRVEIGQFSMPGCLSWWSEWSASPAGACSLEDNEWVRIDADGEPVLPLFRPRA
jgi:hypothetical protein